MARRGSLSVPVLVPVHGCVPCWGLAAVVPCGFPVLLAFIKADGKHALYLIRCDAAVSVFYGCLGALMLIVRCALCCILLLTSM